MDKSMPTVADLERRAKHRGRAYMCVRCFSRDGKQYVETKKRLEEHIMKNHLSLDQLPYYCTLCLFRTTEREALLKHATVFRRHTQMVVERNLGPEHLSRCLVENPNPYIMGPADYISLSVEESRRRFLEKGMQCKDLVGEDLLALATEEIFPDASTDNAERTIPCVPQPVHIPAGGLQPQILNLADALDDETFPSFQPTMVNQALPQPPLHAQMQGNPSLPPVTIDSGSSRLPAVMNINSVVRPTLGVSPARIVRQVVRTPTPVRFCSPPVVPAAAQVVLPARQVPSTLCTPITDQPVNVLDQLLPPEDTVISSPKRTLPDMESDQEGAKKKKTEERSRPVSSCSSSTVSSSASDTVGERVKEAMEEATKVMKAEIEKNSRAIRGVEKAISTHTDMLRELKGAMERLTDAINRHEREERHREDRRREEKKAEGAEEKKTEKTDDRSRRGCRPSRDREDKENRMKSVLGRAYGENKDCRRK